MSQENVELTRRAFQTFDDRDLDTLIAILDDDMEDLLHDRQQRLLGAPTRLQKAREVAARRSFGICNSISPALVSQRRDRYPLRWVARSSGRRSPSSAPTSSETSASISSRATVLTDSRITSARSSRSTCRTTSSTVILSRPAIAGLPFVEPSRSPTT